jgi:hypothetical protein
MRRRTGVAAWIAIILPAAVACPVHGQIPCEYEVAAVMTRPPCSFWGWPGLTGRALNSRGDVCGRAGRCWPDDAEDAFVWLEPANGGPLIILPLPPGAVSASAHDISDNRLVCGTAIRADGRYRGFVYDINTGTYIAELAPENEAAYSWAYAINSAGMVCGTRSTGNIFLPRQAYVWSPSSGFTDIPGLHPTDSSAYDINEAGLVCGTSGWITGQGFVSDGTTTTLFGPIPGGMTSGAPALNESGVVVSGGTHIVDGETVYLPYLWSNGAWLGIPTVAGFPFSGPSSINDHGLMTGIISTGENGGNWAGVWSASAVAEFNTLIPGGLPFGSCCYQDGSCDGPYTPGECMAIGGVYDPYLVRGAVDINNSGMILSQIEYDAGGGAHVMLRPVLPEPGDATCDRRVNVSDLLALLAKWGPCLGCREDLDSSGSVDILDVIIVLGNWG